MIQSKIPIRKKYTPKGLTILYDDPSIIVIDKSSGLLCDKTQQESERTALKLMTYYIRKGSPKSRLELFSVHWLERDISGLVVFAKNPTVQKKLQDQWKHVTMKYLALTTGVCKEKSGILQSYLAEDKSRLMRSVENPKDGMLAKTEYSVLQESNRYSLLAITLQAGKAKQIQVQLAEMGHPIIGDNKYGTPSKNRLALHAWQLKLNHPIDKSAMEFETKIPHYFSKYFEKREEERRD